MQESDKLADRCEVLKQQMLEAQREEAAAEEKTEQAQTRYIEYFEEHEKAQEEIKNLARETCTIIGKTFDAGAKVKEMFAGDCDHLRSQLLDPLLDDDPSIEAGISELQFVQDGMEAMFKKMAEVNEKVRGAQAAAAELATERAEATAKEATEAAATAVKTVAAPGAASASSGATKASEESIRSRQAARISASVSARGRGAWEVPLELGKPVHERTPEDAVAAAKACNIARTDRAEQIAADEEMDADLATS